MRPDALTSENFQTYPPEARSLAAKNLLIFRQLPLSFLPLMLRELIVYDWRFPAERRELDKQFVFLNKLTDAQLASMMAPFSKITLLQELVAFDWVNQPVQFSERLTAHLWATHQIDAFRDASLKYIQKVNSSEPDAALPVPRLAMVLVGADATGARERVLFRNLRPHGVHCTNVQAKDGSQVFFDTLRQRASAHPAPYGHWYIDGANTAESPDAITCISYQRLQPVCDTLLHRMTSVMQPGGGGPELLRTQLAALKPEDVGLTSKGGSVQARFELSLLTEGSGTQIYSTSFVQWAAREALRRAQPYTLLARFTPRRRDAPIGAPGASKVPFDPEASLVDADLGAYYTWINQQRLPGADESRFIVWFEGHNQALAIGPGLRGATEDTSAATLHEILQRLA